MVKREELEAMIKEKILLIGDSGTGKTYTAVKLAEFVAEHGKSVTYLDPDIGCERELELLSDEVLDKIELKVCKDWLELKEAIYNKDGSFLKVLDGLSATYIYSKSWAENRFKLKGRYVVSDKEKEILDKAVFTLPWASYPVVYDCVRSSCYDLAIKQEPHIICTMHALGESEARLRLTEDIYRKFDTVIELRRNISEKTSLFIYDGVLRKHRGRPFTAVAVLAGHVKQLKKLFARRIGVELEDEEKEVQG